MSNSHGSVSGSGVSVDEPVPDLFSVGAESTTFDKEVDHSWLLTGKERPTSKPAALRASF